MAKSTRKRHPAVLAAARLIGGALVKKGAKTAAKKAVKTTAKKKAAKSKELNKFAKKVMKKETAQRPYWKKKATAKKSTR